jgi:nucleoid-associated protein YgaU
MGGAGIIVAIFLAFSMTVSWISGDKENESLEDSVAAARFEKRNVEGALNSARQSVVQSKKELEDSKKRLKKMNKAKKNIQRDLIFEKRQRRRAVKLGSALDLGTAREELRQELKAEAQTEVNDLLDRLEAVEKSKSDLEEDLRFKIEEETRAKTEEAWMQAELANVKAEEATIYSEALTDRLKELERSSEELEYERKELVRKLEEEKGSRQYLEARLRDAENSLAPAVGLSDGAAPVSSYDEEAWEQAEIARVRAEDVAIKNEELIDRLRRMEKNLEDASDALKYKEEDREELADSLREEQETRVVLEDRLADAEEALELARNRDVRKEEDRAEDEDSDGQEVLSSGSEPMIKEESADVEAIAFLEKSRNEAIEKLVDKEIEVQNLSTRFEDLNAEVEVVRESVEKKADRIATLEAELKDSRRVGETLRIEAESNIEKLTLMERQLTSLRDAAGLADRIDALEKELSMTLEEKEGLGETTAIEIKNLMLASQEFKLRNMELDRSLQETQKTLDEALAAKKLAKELMDRNAELEARFKEAGLVTVAGETLDAVALKLVERNKEIEMLLRETERKLAEMEARANGISLADKKAELNAEFKGTESSVKELNAATDRMKTLDDRNVELEAMILEAQESLTVAEIEIAGFKLEELNAKNIELEVGIKEARDAKGASDAMIAEFKLANQRLEERLEKESELNEEYRIRLMEIDAGRAESKESIEQTELAMVSVEQDLTIRVEAASILEAKIKEYQARESANMARIDGLEEAAAEIAEEHAAEIEAIRASDTVLLEKAELARLELERKLALEIEARQATAARTATIEEASVEDDSALIERAELAKIEVEERLLDEIGAREAAEEHIRELESARASAEAALERVEMSRRAEVPAASVEDDSALIERAELAKIEAEERLLDEIGAREAAEEHIRELESAHVSAEAALDKATSARIEMEQRLSIETVQLEAAEGRIRELEASRAETEAALEKVESARLEIERKLGKDSVAHKVAEERVKLVESIRAEVEIELKGAELAKLEADKKITIKETARKADADRKGRDRLEKEAFLAGLISGEFSDEDVDEFMGSFGDAFDTYVVKRGDSLWSIASRRDVYGDPYKWPLLYKYNTRNFDSPDAIEPGRKLVIYNDVTSGELMDADKKARFRGEWKDWGMEQRNKWMSDWLTD